MKAIVLDAVLSGFRSRKDRSMGFSVSTPELEIAHKVALMELEGINVRVLLEPKDYTVESKVVVDKEIHSKTPSERLRSVLYIKFKQQSEVKDFTEYYLKEMDRVIETEKSTLEPTPF